MVIEETMEQRLEHLRLAMATPEPALAATANVESDPLRRLRKLEEREAGQRLAREADLAALQAKLEGEARERQQQQQQMTESERKEREMRQEQRERERREQAAEQQRERERERAERERKAAEAEQQRQRQEEDAQKREEERRKQMLLAAPLCHNFLAKGKCLDRICRARHQVLTSDFRGSCLLQVGDGRGRWLQLEIRSNQVAELRRSVAEAFTCDVQQLHFVRGASKVSSVLITDRDVHNMLVACEQHDYVTFQ